MVASERKIQLISLDEAWDKIEKSIVDTLWEYDIKTIHKDAKILIGRIMIEYILNKITTCNIEFENTVNGIITRLSSKKYPFVIFYIDENKINKNKEILKIIDYVTFLKLLRELVRDLNTITNNRVLWLKFPFDLIKNVSISENGNSPQETYLKSEILHNYAQKKKVPIQRILKTVGKYDMKLSELQKRKVIF